MMRKRRLFHRWQPVVISDRLAPRATGRDGRAVRDRRAMRDLPRNVPPVAIGTLRALAVLADRLAAPANDAPPF